MRDDRATRQPSKPCLTMPSDRPPHPAQDAHSKLPWRRVALVALAVGGVYALSSWNMLLQPTAHFHFVDLANSFLHGRLDTDTPRRYAGRTAQPDDPPGLQDAVNRALKGGGGWNDWASYRVLTLAGGQEVRGVFPYKDTDGPRKHEFWSVDGSLMIIDPTRDLARGCEPDRPQARCDRVVYQIGFPPFPALVMAPAVAVVGYHFNDVIFTLLFGVLSAVLLLVWFTRLRRLGLTRHTPAEQLWLVAMFAFGTVAWYCAIRGEVWFTALTMGVTLHLAFLLAAQGARHPLLAGLLLGLGVATRTPLLFAAVFFPLEALFPEGRWLGGEGAAGLKRAAGRIALFCLPMAAIGLTLAWYNWARWQNPLEFGHFYLLEGTRAPTRDHGLFNFTFLNRNLSAALTNLPRLTDHAPFVQITRHGLGILACTPALFVLFGCREPQVLAPQDDDALERRRAGLVRNLALAVFAVAAPALLYQNDGWQQFGYRFALDFWPALMGVFALRVGPLSRRVKVLILIGIAVQLFGALTFGRFEQFYYD